MYSSAAPVLNSFSNRNLCTRRTPSRYTTGKKHGGLRYRDVAWHHFVKAITGASESSVEAVDFLPRRDTMRCPGLASVSGLARSALRLVSTNATRRPCKQGSLVREQPPAHPARQLTICMIASASPSSASCQRKCSTSGVPLCNPTLSCFPKEVEVLGSSSVVKGRAVLGFSTDTRLVVSTGCYLAAGVHLRDPLRPPASCRDCRMCSCGRCIPRPLSHLEAFSNPLDLLFCNGAQVFLERRT